MEKHERNGAESNGQLETASAKQRLPETQYFYDLAMRRSAEIKSKGDAENSERG